MVTPFFVLLSLLYIDNFMHRSYLKIEKQMSRPGTYKQQIDVVHTPTVTLPKQKIPFVEQVY